MISKVKLYNALEFTRLRGELPDLRIIFKVFCWLQSQGSSAKKFASLYANTIIGIAEGLVLAFNRFFALSHLLSLRRCLLNRTALFLFCSNVNIFL